MKLFWAHQLEVPSSVSESDSPIYASSDARLCCIICAPPLLSLLYHWEQGNFLNNMYIDVKYV